MQCFGCYSKKIWKEIGGIPTDICRKAMTAISHSRSVVNSFFQDKLIHFSLNDKPFSDGCLEYACFFFKEACMLVTEGWLCVPKREWIIMGGLGIYSVLVSLYGWWCWCHVENRLPTSVMWHTVIIWMEDVTVVSETHLCCITTSFKVLFIIAPLINLVSCWSVHCKSASHHL